VRDAIALHATPGIPKWKETAFGNVRADVLDKLLPGYVRPNFCELIAHSPFRD